MIVQDAQLKFTAQPLHRTKTDELILHHAAAEGSVESIHNYHLHNNNWLGIGYHYYVRKDGSIWKGRPEDSVGAHTLGHNYQSIGVCFEGNFERDTMSAAQLLAGKKLISDIVRRYPGIKVSGHRDNDTTACPGKNFPDELFEVEDLYMDIESLINNMTDEQAYRVMEKAQRHAAELQPPGWAEEELDAAVAAGITDGERPMQLVPRYQAALMALRAKQ